MIDRPLRKEAAWRPRRADLAEEQIVRRLRQQEVGRDDGRGVPQVLQVADTVL
jgi:hypothetical protein